MTWKAPCIMQMSSWYASDFPVKSFSNLVQHVETMQKKVREKRNHEYSFSIRVQTTLNHISICSYHNWY